MTEHRHVATKKAWVPEWLWWLACVHVPVVSFRQLVLTRPIRRLLTDEVPPC